jgi:hypothetical protein
MGRQDDQTLGSRDASGSGMGRGKVKMTPHKILELIEKVDPEEEPIKAHKWVRLHFLKDGRSGFGQMVYDTEEAAGGSPTWEDFNGRCVSRFTFSPDHTFIFKTKPCGMGEEIRYPNKLWSHHIPYPLL